MFFSSKKGELILILDVQSSIVRGTLVHFRFKDKPHVLFTHNVDLPYQTNVDSRTLITEALKAVDQVINETLKNLSTQPKTDPAPKKISKIHYVLSSPWIHSQAKTLSVSFDKDTNVSRPYILGLISQERSKLVSIETKNIRVVEEKVFDVRLNGYSVTSWENQECHKLEISFVVSIAEGNITDQFIKACDHAIDRKHVVFHSSLFLQHIGIQKIIPNRSSYALIHVHGELTDVALIQDNSCLFFGSYPFGIQTVIRTIARKAGLDEKSAESVLNLWVKGSFDGVHAKDESLMLEELKKKWMEEFRSLLKTSSTPLVVPRHIVISAHSHEDFFISSFTESFPQTSIQLLVIEDILPKVDYALNVDRLRQTGLYALAIHSLN